MVNLLHASETIAPETEARYPGLHRELVGNDRWDVVNALQE